MRCASCQKQLSMELSARALEEFKETFGVSAENADDKLVVICDPCYQQMHPKDHPQQVIKTRQYLKAKLN